MQRTHLRLFRSFAVGAALLSMLSVTPAFALGASSTYASRQFAGDDGAATAAYLDQPKGLVAMKDGSLIIADSVNNVLRKIDANGIISTFSGTGDFGRVNGNRTSATWSEPEGIARNAADILYVADTGSNTIRTINGNTVKTLPITGLSRPHAVVIHRGFLYISDTGNGRVVRTGLSGGRVRVIASKLKTPLKMTVSGNTLYVVENEKGRVLGIHTRTLTKKVVAEGLTQPRAIAADHGLLYIAAGASGIWNELWKVNPRTKTAKQLAKRRETELLNQTSDLIVRKVSGKLRLFQLQNGGSSMYSTDLKGNDLILEAGKKRFGDEQGALAAALLGRPHALVASPDGTKMYVSYAQGNKIAAIDVTNGTVSVLAGHVMDNYREGTGTDARFSDVANMAISADGATLYIADRNSQRIRSINTATGTTSYLTGAGIINLIDPNDPAGVINPSIKNGYAEGSPCDNTFDRGVTGCAYFNRPSGIALSPDGTTLYVADTANRRIRAVDVATGITSFIAGSGEKGFADGVGAAATFKDPFSLTVAANGKTLYVVDRGNHALRAVDLASLLVTTLTGKGRAGYRDGEFSKAFFSTPEYIALGPDGNLYVSEAGSMRIRKLDLTAQTTSLVSGSGKRGKKNGTALVAKWNGPKGLTFIGSRLYISDFRNDLIRALDI